MKSKKSDRREVFVLTPEEKRTLSFVLIAFLLGIGAKHYRETHAVPSRQAAITDVAKTVALPAQKRAEAKRRKQAK
ncbi:MAG: hypothetical protein ABR611_03960 [Chthoniobacterales bacterium]